MSRITGKMILYGAILLLLTVGLIAFSRQLDADTGLWVLGGWAVLYSLTTFFFLRSEDVSRTRGNLKFTYGLIAVIAVFPVIIIGDIMLSTEGENPIADKPWVIPGIVLIVIVNYLIQRRSLKGYRKQEVFK